MIEVNGKGGISVKIIAHSKSSIDDKEIITFELVYHRFIHSELMTHRLFSRNAASSRAIPVSKMIDTIAASPAMPIHWGKNQQGMQANEECRDMVDCRQWDGGYKYVSREAAWNEAKGNAIEIASSFNDAGYHKQIVNRLLEPFQMMKTIVTATEFDNWFWLRVHPDAAPEIAELAKTMLEAYKQSQPEVLEPGEWHTPYVDHTRVRGHIEYFISGEFKHVFMSKEDALKVSSSCCAQVSYRLLDNSVEKALVIYDKLVNSTPCHSSPFENQATPMKEQYYEYCEDCIDDIEINLSYIVESWEEGITHSDRAGNLWSGNFKGWVQYRQLIPNNACWEYEK
jgi:thymidylate synthase ThyX